MEERSIYLISSISRLIFSPGLTKRDGKESERGREGEADRDRDRPERKKERKKGASQTKRPTDQVFGGRGRRPISPSFLPSFIRPSEIVLVSSPLAADFLSPPSSSHVAPRASLRGSQGGRAVGALWQLVSI